MRRWKCNRCGKLFSRNWNLQRHVETLHNTKGDRRNSVFHDYDLPLNSVRIINYENKENYVDSTAHHQKSHYHDNFPNTLSNFRHSEYGYYPSYLSSLFEEEKRFSVDDRIRIQKGLKILENHLEKIYPPTYVFQIISSINRLCILEKSDMPLKKFMTQNNLGHLWAF